MTHRKHDSRIHPYLLLSLFLLFGVPGIAHAQETTEAFYKRSSIKVFHLANVGQVNEANDILTALRNVLDPRVKIYLLTTSNDVVVDAPPEEITRIGELLTELDRPKRAFRITYTLAESDAGKRIGVQHFSMVALLGQRITLKQGDKVPVATGSFEQGNAASQTQFTYIDIGINLDTTIDAFANGLRLRSKVEQSSVAAGPQSGKLADDPIVRQSVLEGTSVITPGKPFILGGIDIVGSTRHIDIEVMAEPLP